MLELDSFTRLKTIVNRSLLIFHRLPSFLRAVGPSNRGYTLVEVLVVITIIGILASSVVMLSGQNRQKQARDSVRKANFKAIALALESHEVRDVFDFNATEFGFPPSLKDFPLLTGP